MESEEQGLLWLGYELPPSRGQSEICGGRRLGRQRTSIPAQGTRRVFSRVVSSATFHCCLGLAWLGIAAMPTGKGTCNILDEIGASVCPRFPWRTYRWVDYPLVSAMTLARGTASVSPSRSRPLVEHLRHSTAQHRD